MGILDTLIGTNTSAGTQQGAQLGTQALMGADQSGNQALRKYVGQGNTALNTNTQAGLGTLNSGYGSAVNALTNYGNQAQGQLRSGVNAGTSTVLGGNASYQPYLQSGSAANSLYSDALGLNGAGGNAAATAAFQTSPGYAFQVDQSTGAAERAAAAAGGLGSGSVLDAVTRLGSNLANTEYGNWLGNLQGLGAQGLNAANSVSANNQTAGGYQMTGGTAGASLTGSLGSSLGNAYVGQGTGEAGLYSNLGQGLSSNLTGLGSGISANNMNEATSVANLDLSAGQAQDQATNANAGILSKLIGGIAGLPLGGNSLSAPSTGTGGFSITPGTNGSFSIAPSASGASSSGGSGIFGPMIANAGKSLANFL